MVIAIEGTIGAGKTTVMTQFNEEWPGTCSCVYEPVKEWTENTTMLADLYNEPKRHAFGFEVGSILQLSKHHPEQEQIIIQERSIFAAYYVFSTCQHELGDISQAEFDMLTELMERSVPRTKTEGIFYLRIDSGTA